MLWKAIYILTVWPLIVIIEALALMRRVINWAHGWLFSVGVRWTKFCERKVGP